MLMTDLSAAEIVLGKLAARLVPVLLMLACTFPVLEILTLLGGVDPNALLGAFAVTAGVAVLAVRWRWPFALGEQDARGAAVHLCDLVPVAAGRADGRPACVRPSAGPGSTPPRRSEPFFLALAPYWSPGSGGMGRLLVVPGSDVLDLGGPDRGRDAPDSRGLHADESGGRGATVELAVIVAGTLVASSRARPFPG